ncbi:rust resistance kinase Lr10 isoform X1 [Cryptomeria japonica]|uniref:rust resistance kinase Lr10 isoform X1 n=1 Tax=Cryptomeria japonica TaxID=3369 RepID=UPI0027DA8A1D|nr:rust resistance kinase Lr10 isoform X1 [Cryptomeria japonica]
MAALQIDLTVLQPHTLRLSRFLFFVAISLSCLAFHCNGVCEVFSCGNYSMDFPFGKLGSGCGDPKLQVECDNTTQKPLINIGGYQYYILESRSYSPNTYPSMRILYKKFEQDECALSESVYDQFWSAEQFHIVGGYTNLTLWKTCNTGDGYGAIPGLSNLTCNEHQYFTGSPLDLSQYCTSDFRITLNRTVWASGKYLLSQMIDQGITIEWLASGDCKHCETDSRNCTHLISSSFCYCDAMSYSQCSSVVGNSKTPVILGAAIGGGVLFVAAILIVVFCRKRSSAAKELQLRMAMEPSLTKVEQFLDDYAHEMPTRYSFSQLKKITNNFADKLGEGGFGVVYKGKLPRGNLVAVKILDQSRHIEIQFMNEVATIGRIHHVHLVRLMGYCFDGFRSALIYEYMVNGSLEKFIFVGEKKGRILNGEELYSIALGTARGIAYLHQDCQRRIIHFDIKPHNILLDEDFTPKVADFGLAKLCGKKEDHISMTAARGTPGYAAPEVWNRNLGPVTGKSDVYSFGMVLLEIVGGRKNIELQADRSSQLYLPEWVFKLMQNGQLEMMLRGRGKEEIKWEDEEKARRLAKVGLWCIQYNSRDRPSMSRVVQMLEGNGHDVSNPPLPFNSAPASQAVLPFSSEEFSSTV